MPGGPGQLEVRYVDREGRAIPRARISVGSPYALTDEEGWARWSSFAVGEYEIQAQGAGHVPTTRTVRVEAGRTTRVVLTASPRGWMDLYVLGPDGDPLPHAVFDVYLPSRLPWIDLQDGVQRLDPFTDERGHRHLDRLEPGKVTLDVLHGPYARRIEIDIGEGRNPDLVVQFRPEDLLAREQASEEE